MKIVEFYRGERANSNGSTLAEIMEFTHGQLEMDHDYVQWIFPSNEPSMLNGDAPCLTREEAEVFLSNPELQVKVVASFEKMLDFLGFVLNDNTSGAPKYLVEDILSNELNKDPQWWMGSFNHNCLRVTRMLKCLRLLGLEEYAVAFHAALLRHKAKFSENT